MTTQTKLSVLAVASRLLCCACGGGGGGDGNAPSTAGGGSSGSACPTPTGGNQSGSGTTLSTLVDPVVLQEIRAQGLPGMTVAVAKNGTILYSQGYGYADLGTCLPMPADAEMQIGSVTKQFTAAAVLQLYSAGTLDIDKPLITYLPTYTFDPRITPRMLLNQTSGLQDYIYFPELARYANGGPESVALNAIVQRTLNFTPGTQYQYSSSNYFILGSVIEAVSSGTYADYLASHVLAAAGLSNTFYQRPAQSASPYEFSATGPVPGRVFDPSVYFAAGALSFVWHNGQTTSYTSFNGILTDDGFSIAILTNVPTQEQTPLLNLAQTLIESICNSAATASSC